MKKQKFLKYLNRHKCVSYTGMEVTMTLFKTNKTGKKTTIPRHKELDNKLCKLICKQLKIPDPF